MSSLFRYLVNATIDSTLSSPLESPDILQPFLPFGDIGAATNSMASIKLSSADSINIRNQQVRPIRLTQFPSYNIQSTTLPCGMSLSYGLNNNEIVDNINSKSLSAIPETISEIPELIMTSETSVKFVNVYDEELTTACDRYHQINHFRSKRFQSKPDHVLLREGRAPLVEFSLSSVGRSFIDDIDENEIVLEPSILQTPDTPTPNISPSSSNRFSETFSNDFNRATSTPSITVSPIEETARRKFVSSSGTNLCGSWDLLELDLNFHDVNFDPSFGGDVEECVFFHDDPLGVLPKYPTPPDVVDL